MAIAVTTQQPAPGAIGLAQPRRASAGADVRLWRAPARSRAGRASADTRDATDRALVRRVQAGERRAFDQIVSRYQHRIANVVAQYVRDPREVEDVVQDAFLKAYRALARFRGESSLYTWLYRIAVNTAKNHLDAMSRRVTGQGLEPDEAERYDEGALLRHGDTPERQACRDDLSQALERALAELPRHLCDALMLREREGLSYEAIARRMDCPVGTVRSRIARARGLIDDTVAPLLDDPLGSASTRPGRRRSQSAELTTPITLD